jgi:hypothetical protein
MADEKENEPMPAVFKLALKTPLVTHQGSLDAIEIREPKARDMAAMKVSPSMFYTDGRFVVQHDVMLGYLVRLTGLDRIVLEDLSGPDFNSASSVVREYLGQAGNY